MAQAITTTKQTEQASVPSNETAEQAYVRHAQTIVALAQRLGVALGGHLGGNTPNWAHVGDLAYVEETIKVAVDFLEGND